MSRQRFDLLFRCLRFGEQPLQKPPGMSFASYRWLLIDDFVQNFNDHRRSTFIPGSTICVDESISRWYGLGGSWVKKGLPHYVAIDRKPENGCEIQNSACGVSGVLLRLKKRIWWCCAAKPTGCSIDAKSWSREYKNWNGPIWDPNPSNTDKAKKEKTRWDLSISVDKF